MTNEENPYRPPSSANDTQKESSTDDQKIARWFLRTLVVIASLVATFFGGVALAMCCVSLHGDREVNQAVVDAIARSPRNLILTVSVWVVTFVLWIAWRPRTLLSLVDLLLFAAAIVLWGLAFSLPSILRA